MTQVQRCKVCGKVFRKTHQCSGEKKKIPCPKCHRKFAESWLAEHIKNGCSKPKPKEHLCGCGQVVTRGHGNEEFHLKSYVHKQWEIRDTKERKLGVVKGSSGFYKRAKPEDANFRNPNYFRGIAKPNCSSVCEWLANQNKDTTTTDIIYCYCGINCPRMKYTQHCDTDFHIEWVNKARQYYDEKKAKISEETQKRKARKLKQNAKICGKRTNPESSQFGNFLNFEIQKDKENTGKSTDVNIEDIKENPNVNQELIKNVKEFVKTLKCTGDVAFFRSNEISQIEEIIENNKYF